MKKCPDLIWLKELRADDRRFKLTPGAVVMVSRGFMNRSLLSVNMASIRTKTSRLQSLNVSFLPSRWS